MLLLLLLLGSCWCCMAAHGATCAMLSALLMLAILTLAILTGPELVLAMLTLTLLLLRCMLLGGGCMISLHACSEAVMESVSAVEAVCCMVLLLIIRKASLSCMMSWRLSISSWRLSCSSWLTTFFSWLLTVASRSFPAVSSRLCALLLMSAWVSEYCLESTLRAGEPPHFIVGSKSCQLGRGGQKRSPRGPKAAETIYMMLRLMLSADAAF